jgi:hypothetical protein
MVKYPSLQLVRQPIRDGFKFSLQENMTSSSNKIDTTAHANKFDRFTIGSLAMLSIPVDLLPPHLIQLRKKTETDFYGKKAAGWKQHQSGRTGAAHVDIEYIFHCQNGYIVAAK